MLHFRELDVYRCAIAVLPKAYAIATELDGEMAGQLRRAALSISVNIAEELDDSIETNASSWRPLAARHLSAARSSTRCGRWASHAEVEASDLLLVRIVSMLTKMIG